MIADALVFLKNRLNAHFLSISGTGSDTAGEDKVVFIDGNQKPEAISFKLGTVSLMLLNIERDAINRQADSYVRTAENGMTRKVNPEVNIDLYILFVTKFTNYDQSLHYLSLILSYFQTNHYFDRSNAPDLSKNIDHLMLELNTQTPAQQNQLWGTLRSSPLPCLIYKVKTLTFIDEGQLSAPDISDVILNQQPL